MELRLRLICLDRNSGKTICSTAVEPVNHLCGFRRSLCRCFQVEFSDFLERMEQQADESL